MSSEMSVFVFFFLILHSILTWAADHNFAVAPCSVTHLFAWEHPASCMCEDFQGESRTLISFDPSSAVEHRIL